MTENNRLNTFNKSKPRFNLSHEFRKTLIIENLHSLRLHSASDPSIGADRSISWAYLWAESRFKMINAIINIAVIIAINREPKATIGRMNSVKRSRDLNIAVSRVKSGTQWSPPSEWLRSSESLSTG